MVPRPDIPGCGGAGDFVVLWKVLRAPNVRVGVSKARDVG